MSNIALNGLLVTLAVFVLVTIGYFVGLPLWKRSPPHVRRFVEVIGHGLLLGGWIVLQYPILKDHHSVRDWQLYFSLTVVVVWAVVTVKRIAETLTSADESFGSGSHA